jgi:hypothetical protein
MAVIPFVQQAYNGEGELYKATLLATSDETSVLTFNEGQADIAVHVYGTFGGSTVTIKGSLLGAQFTTTDDAYGQALSFTSDLGPKPVGPALSDLKGSVTGGTSVVITIDVKVVRRAR